MPTIFLTSEPSLWLPSIYYSMGIVHFLILAGVAVWKLREKPKK